MTKLGTHGILLKRITEDKERKTSSGIIIPQSVKNSIVEGKVINTGAGTRQKPMEVSVGDTVQYEANLAMEIEMENEKFDVIDLSSVLFIL